MEIAVSRTYIWNENEMLCLMLDTTVTTVKLSVINGIYNSHKWCHKNINVGYVINFDMLSHTCNLNQVPANTN